MEKFYGFDLGDAESAVTRLEKKDQETPEVLTVQEAKSFITAYALRRDGQLLIGEGACYEPNAIQRRIRFKSRYLTDRSVRNDIKSFAAGVLGELILNGDLIRGDDQCFYIGCPAGWDKVAREEYRQIFESAGFPPLKIVSESRAALVSACQSKHMQVCYDILSRPVLVVDIGSSTTDFAYIMGGKEVALKTGGEVMLGGGIMDEILLEESVAASPDAKNIRKIFEESEAWKTYCEFAARRLKEKYFTDEEYWSHEDCVQTVTIRAKLLPVRLKLKMSAQIAERLLEKKVDRLGGKSFTEVFKDSLRQVRENIEERQPELIFMTGGVSKMEKVRDWCREVFPEAVVICGSEPEFSVAKGLAWCGRIDEELREFKKEIQELIDSTVIEGIVSRHIDALYRGAVEALVDPLLEKVALPIVDRWRDGAVETLADIDPIMEREIEEFLHSDEGRAHLARAVDTWLKTVAYSLEEHTMPICARHNVPYSVLNLSSYLSLQDIDIDIDTKSLFAVDEVTFLIDTIVTILVGILCGGSGIALVASGVVGILIGVVVSALVLALGKDTMQSAFTHINIPGPVRKLMPKSYLKSKADRISAQVKDDLYKKLEREKNAEITERLIGDISHQIETCLTKMAEVVEIPLG